METSMFPKQLGLQIPVLVQKNGVGMAENSVGSA